MPQTSNSSLQSQLEQWCSTLNLAQTLAPSSAARTEAIEAFCSQFVPSDVSPDDLTGFVTQLAGDEEHFDAFCREIKQCASGEGVETIAGNQSERAVFTLLPPADSGISVDIVREVAFLLQNGKWCAEG